MDRRPVTALGSVDTNDPVPLRLQGARQSNA